MKPVPTGASAGDFLAAVPDPRRRADAQTVCDLMADVTGEPPVMWGSSIVGFGRLPLSYRSGGSGEWMVVGLSPRKAATVLYLMDGYAHRTELLDRLGPHTIGKSCLYLKRLGDVDLGVLRELVTDTVRRLSQGE